MADLTKVQARTNTQKPTVAREYIALKDYHGLIDLLSACACTLGNNTESRSESSFMTRIESLWKDLSFVIA